MRRHPKVFCFFLFFLLFFRAGEILAGPATQPYVLHFPGIGGILAVDRGMVVGLRRGGVEGQIQVYDWTSHDPGIHALHALDRNQDQAARVAKFLAAKSKADPSRRIVLISHSGGGAIAVWVLERLPADVTVDSAILLAPALSPGYDLSNALRHVKTRMYVFSSTRDELVLGMGCRLCGTMDGQMMDAAGLVGFSQPPTADKTQYQKLKQYPYDPAWMDLGNFGDHIGPMASPFVKSIIAPLVLEGQPDDVVNAPRIGQSSQVHIPKLDTLQLPATDLGAIGSPNPD
jgi:pimeloyl-ACP methyl ester carboxylesterase